MVVHYHFRSGATGGAEGGRRRSEAEGSTPAGGSGCHHAPPPLAVFDSPRKEPGAGSPFREPGSTPGGERTLCQELPQRAERFPFLLSFKKN